jgi:hypothetical protein
MSHLSILLFGGIGFALLGYANQKLASGVRFRDQPNSQKRIIVAVSLAQFPFLFMILFGGVQLALGR